MDLSIVRLWFEIDNYKQTSYKIRKLVKMLLYQLTATNSIQIYDKLIQYIRKQTIQYRKKIKIVLAHTIKEVQCFYLKIIFGRNWSEELLCLMIQRNVAQYNPITIQMQHMIYNRKTLRDNPVGIVNCTSNLIQ